MEETSPVAQWLRLSAAAAGTMGSIPAQGMKIPQAAWPMKENSLKDKQKCYGRVDGKLIMYSWAPHRRQNLSWDRMADWLKSGRKKKKKGVPEKLTTAAACLEAWHREGLRGGLLFCCEAPAGLSGMLVRRTVSALNESWGPR